MKHILMVVSLIFVSTLVSFSQTNIQKAPDTGLKLKLPMSPMMGFDDNDSDPFRMQYLTAYTVKGNPQKVEVELVPKNISGKNVRSYTVYCEEEFTQPKEGNVVKNVRLFTAQEKQSVLIQVEKDSTLTFRVGTVQFEDGTVWSYK